MPKLWMHPVFGSACVVGERSLSIEALLKRTVEFREVRMQT